VKLQEYVKAKGLKVVVVFEGRDAAGKGGVISRIASAMSPRICRVVALSAPSDREKTQWYFQRYGARRELLPPAVCRSLTLAHVCVCRVCSGTFACRWRDRVV
jgi:polyphosphate kinase 2 (PPK2 family)